MATEFATEKLKEGAVAFVKLMLDGNKDECDAGLPDKQNIEAVCFMQGGIEAKGYHLGSRATTFVKNRLCGCLMPLFTLSATGKGEFNGKTDNGRQVKYVGDFLDNVFNHVDTNNPAEFFFDGEWKYEGLFKNGKKHNQGKFYQWDEDACDWFCYQNGTFVEDKFMTGKQYIMSKKGHYRSFKNGFEGEEGFEEPEGQAENDDRANINGTKMNLGKDAKVNVKTTKMGDIQGTVAGNANIGKKLEHIQDAQVNSDLTLMGHMNGQIGGDLNFG